MRLSTLLFILFAVLPSSLAVAAEASPKQDLAAGIVLVESGKYGEAAVLFRKVVSDRPEDPEANYYLGRALSGLADKEGENFLKKSLMLTPESPATNLALGEVYFNKNIYAEAADYFENTRMLAPGSEFARRADEYLRKMAKKKPSRWDVSILTGLQYDSNVIMNGSDTPLPMGFSRKSDWRGVLSLAGNYSFFRNEKFEVKGGYSLYQSFHTKLDDFNITQNLLGLSGSYVITPAIRLTTEYLFEYLLVEGDQYDTAHSIAPSLVFDLGRWGITNLGYRYSSIAFKDSAQFLNNSYRNGDKHLVEVIHTVPVAKNLSIWAGYAHVINSARTSNWDYQGDRVIAGIRSALPFQLTADIYGEYYRRSYGGFDPTFALTREDQQYTVSVSLERKLTERISLVLNELYTRNHSNVKTFDYERSITGLFMKVRLYE